jgi:hypothetical protein
LNPGGLQRMGSRITADILADFKKA